jgi:hypothetical protein
LPDGARRRRSVAVVPEFYPVEIFREICHGQCNKLQ